MLLEEISDILSEVLGVEREEITSDSNLVDDLAAESIDFVDIIYSLERKYDLKVTPGDIFPAFLQENTFLDDTGEVSRSVKIRLAEEYPHFDQACLSEFFETKQADAFFKVSSIVNFVATKTKDAA